MIVNVAKILGMSFILMAPSTAFGQSQTSRQWSLGLVYSRSGIKRHLIGVVDGPLLAVTTGSLKRTATSSTWTKEVWLVADGKTAAFCCGPGMRDCGVIGRDGKAYTAQVDRGALAEIINRAKPVTRQRAPYSAHRASARYAWTPSRLKELCDGADVILVGRVVGPVRIAHSPINSDNRDQHTVYAIAVELYLKSDNPSEPPVVKMWQEGGGLTWKDPFSGVRGQGHQVEEDPLLNVGDQYVLFLSKIRDDELGRNRRRGYVEAELNYVRGKIAELDEYRCTHHWRGKLLVERGYTRPARTTGSDVLDRWVFPDGNVLNVPLAEAISSIRRMVNR